MTKVAMEAPQENLLVSLPFNKMKQRGVVGHMISEPAFFELCWHQIQPDWFTEELLTRKVYEIMWKWREEHLRAPTAEEIKGSPAVMKEPTAEAKKIQAQVDICLTASSSFHLDALKKELSEWMKSVIFSRSIRQAGQAFNKRDFKTVHNIFSDVVKEANNVQFEDLGEMSFDDPIGHFQQSQTDRQEALTTGLHILDKALLEEADGGGLQKGDTTIILAPSNVGKSTALITMACHNIRDRKSVLFMTHEGPPRDIMNKIWSNLLERPVHELVDRYGNLNGMKMTPEEEESLIMWRWGLKEYFKYIPYNKPGMTIEDVYPIILRAQEERIAKTGKGFDLLVSDYPAKLTTNRASKGNLPRREIDRIVYDYYVQLALDHKFHSLVAIQTNREGSKVNRGKEERLLTMEDVSESWGAMEMATTVITLNRSELAKQNERMTMYVAKGRGAATGTAIVCNTAFSRSMTHSEQLGATWYNDSGTMEDIIDNLLTQYKGQRIPEERLIY